MKSSTLAGSRWRTTCLNCNNNNCMLWLVAIGCLITLVYIGMIGMGIDVLTYTSIRCDPSTSFTPPHINPTTNTYPQSILNNLNNSNQFDNVVFDQHIITPSILYPESDYNIYGWHLMALEGSGHHMWYSFLRYFTNQTNTRIKELKQLAKELKLRKQQLSQQQQKDEINNNININITETTLFPIGTMFPNGMDDDSEINEQVVNTYYSNINSKILLFSTTHGQFERSVKACWETKTSYFMRRCRWNKINFMFKHEILLPSFIESIDLIPNNTLFALPWLSYPWGDTIIESVPRITAIIPFLQQSKLRPIRLKMIFEKRDILDIFSSVCLRFTNCVKRVLNYQYILSSMHSILMSLDRRYWIIIDYEKVSNDPKGYSKVILSFLRLDNDKNIVQMFDQLFVQRMIQNHATSLTQNEKWLRLEFAMRNSTTLPKHIMKKKAVRGNDEWKTIRVFIEQTFVGYKQWPLFAQQNARQYLTTVDNYQQHKKQFQW